MASFLLVKFSKASCVDTMPLRERWVYQIRFHFDSSRWSSMSKAGTLVLLKASAVYFPWCCSLVFGLWLMPSTSLPNSAFFFPIQVSHQLPWGLSSHHSLQLSGLEATPNAQQRYHKGNTLLCALVKWVSNLWIHGIFLCHM